MRDCSFEVLVLRAGLVASLLVAAAGCQRQEQQPAAAPNAPAMKAAPPTPIAAKKEQMGGSTWDPSWDAIVEQALPPEMLGREVPRDVQRFCPLFYEMPEADKRAFWAYFFQALAGAEAGMEPTTRVRHTEAAVAVKDRVTGSAVRSEGLLQLTYEDQERYGCDFDWQGDRTKAPTDGDRTILQPKNNLECGVKILRNQMIDLHKPLLSKSSYWSTLRPGTASFQIFAKQMTNPPAACGLRERTGRRWAAR